ncbi:phage tail tube protein [Halorussus marinus]|uniref:phage tail tube protein n=1 Tax=Halorussus marinus TaxID=2505976 RepID=UPI00106EEBB3|nr:phage tail tube protein [Halorussus marinus]
MTAGAATAAFTVENSYGDGPATDPTWYQPGVDVSVGELSVEQALERVRQPDDPTPAGSREGNWEGAASVSFTLTDDNWHDLVFADGGTALPHSAMHAPSAAWYFGNDMPDGTTESRVATGAIVPEATINYEQGSPVTVELTILYGFEPTDVSAPSTITTPSDNDIFEWHGASFQVDGLGQSLMQSATLSLAGLARFRRGQSRHPYDAVVDAVEPSFSTDATFTERDQLAMAVDNVDDTVGKVSATLSFETSQATTIGYNLTGVQPNSYGWSDLVTPDTDLSEPIDYHVADVEVA